MDMVACPNSKKCPETRCPHRAPHTHATCLENYREFGDDRIPWPAGCPANLSMGAWCEDVDETGGDGAPAKA